jgi:hypothetical protein
MPRASLSGAMLKMRALEQIDEHLIALPDRMAEDEVKTLKTFIHPFSSLF